MVTTRRRACAEHAEAALRITVYLIMEQLQPADMKHLRLACTSVRIAIDQAVELLEICNTDLALFRKCSFRPSRFYIVGGRSDDDGDGGLQAVLPRMAARLKHVLKLRLTRCGTSSAFHQVL
jgi:hypothetical protein